MNSGIDSSSRPIANVIPIALTLLAALSLAAPHLADEIWYDEAYTIEFFATGDLADSFTRYEAPNNHIVFSAALSLWRSLGDSVLWLRLLPLASFLLALAILMLAATRLGGPTAGILAGALLATSHVALGFAAQLRAYGPSWLPVAAALLVLPAFLESGSRTRGALYALCAALAVGMLPTNLAAFAALGVFAIIVTLASPQRRTPAALQRLALVLLAPLTGAIFYIPVWHQFIRHARQQWTDETAAGILREWARAATTDFWWLAPLAALGLLALLRSALRHQALTPRSPRGQLALGLSSLVVPFAACATLTHAPFSRTLVPLLPLWCAAAALLIALGWNSILPPTSALRHYGAAILVAVLVILAAVRENDNTRYASRNPDGSRPQNIYDQYYHHQFFPARTIDILHDIAENHPCLILTDNSDLWSLRHALRYRHPQLPLAYYTNPKISQLIRQMSGQRLILIVACSRQRADVIATHVGLGQTPELRLLTSTGFFKIYLHQPPARPANLQLAPSPDRMPL